jgi:pyridoxal phosphate-dependent aminotransferase EpsN
MNDKIWLSAPHLGGTEMEIIKSALDSNWVAPVGPQIEAFENLLCKYTGSSYAAALNSGTSAIHLALRCLNIQKGDIVLCQSLTFVATASPIIYQGATPVFIDSELQSWNICPQALEDAIQYYIAKNKKPKAIIAVHLYGMPFLVDEILSLSQKYEIPLIEDAAESLGSTYKNKHTGTFGDLGIISFNGNKIITTSAGGAILTANKSWINRVKYLATQARDPTPFYQHRDVGYNYAMSNICASIGIGQMSVIAERVEQRRKNHFEYYSRLSDLPGITFQPECEHAQSNRWLTCILIEEQIGGHVHAEHIRETLNADQIESRPVWKPLHSQPIFKQAPYFGGNNSEHLFKKGLCLPSGSSLNVAQHKRITNLIKSLYQ